MVDTPASPQPRAAVVYQPHKTDLAGLKSAEAPAIERLLQERAAPQSLAIVYPQSASTR